MEEKSRQTAKDSPPSNSAPDGTLLVFALHSRVKNGEGITTKDTKVKSLYINKVLGYITLCILFFWSGKRFLDAYHAIPRALPRASDGGSSRRNDMYTKDLWGQIEPKKALEYHDCYDGFQCARLDVPLNWNAGRDSVPRAAIAVIRLPAKVNVTDSRYGGAVLFNPGGPGGSGISDTIARGRVFQTVLDSSSSPNSSASDSTARYFDIISFDPRGIGQTTPHIACFPDAFRSQVWSLQSEAEPQLGRSSDMAFDLLWARSKSLGRSCSEIDESEGMGMLRHVNTAQVVEDMLEIVEMHGAWRQNKTEKLLRKSNSKDAAELRKRLAWEKGYEKLQYWGVSYGSTIGATFASMHPNRVGRILIDGIVDAEDYYQSSWSANLQDTDKVFTQLCTYCFESGPNCPILANSASALEHNIKSFLEDLKHNPIPVTATKNHGPDIITYNDIMSNLGVQFALHDPLHKGEDLVTTFAQLMNGTTSPFIMKKQQQSSRPQITSAPCQKEGDYSQACVKENWRSVATSAVSCMDGDSIENETKDEAKKKMEVVLEQSTWYGWFWPSIRLHCVGWTVRPAWETPRAIGGATAHPLMLIGNTLDPVTPLQNAFKMASKFPGSVVLEQNSEGHGSQSSPSICTAKAIRQYFHTGELPKPGTICKPQKRPFIGCEDRDEKGECQDLIKEDQALYEVMASMKRRW